MNPYHSDVEDESDDDGTVFDIDPIWLEKPKLRYFGSLYGT